MPLFFSFLLILGLGFFFGLAFEEYYVHDKSGRPGGVRTFPLLALTGGMLFRIGGPDLTAVSAGLVILGLWLGLYYHWRLGKGADTGEDHVGLIAPLSNVFAFLLGPITLAGPIWLPVGLTVAAVFLLTGKAQLHRLARQIDRNEILTAGKFLLLTGLVLPILPNHPVTPYISITPQQAWLALLAVCALSYVSYLLQRYVAPRRPGLWVAVLGGLYSSTATTVVIARRLKSGETGLREGQSGVILATSIMYLRMLIIIGAFNLALCLRLAPILLGLSAAGCLTAVLWGLGGGPSASPKPAPQSPANPLQFKAALMFAVLFLVVSAASTLAKGAFGLGGVYGLAAVVGVADIDPFVLSLAQGGAANLSRDAAAAAILIAAASNNLLKAGYVAGFGGWRAAIPPGLVLTGLAALGLAAAFWVRPV